MSVSYDEFKEGLKQSGIPITPGQIDALIAYLDRDGDGEIDFRFDIFFVLFYTNLFLALKIRFFWNHSELVIGDEKNRNKSKAWHFFLIFIILLPHLKAKTKHVIINLYFWISLFYQALKIYSILSFIFDSI